MTAPIVLVLEDSTERMDWLDKALLGTGACVEWATSVRDFFAKMYAIEQQSERREALRLIILDHDLGPSLSGGDEHGETGLDAARSLPTDLAGDVPALVWSVNDTGSRAMHRELVGRGYAVRRLPFLRGNEDALRAIVRGMVEVLP